MIKSFIKKCGHKILESNPKMKNYVYNVARDFVQGVECPSYELETNGEQALLERLSGKLKGGVIVDVGANQGRWYRCARRYFPDHQIYCVEIAPMMWPKLEEATKNDGNAHVIKHGLEKENGQLTLDFYPGATEFSNLFGYPHEGKSEKISVTLKDAQEFVKENNIETIDLLKMDVEGSEYNILKRLEGMLQARSIKVIQFEYGRVNILNRLFLKDYYELMGKYGYKLGKLVDFTVDFRDYELWMEDFKGPNFVAALPEYVAACRGKI